MAELFQDFENSCSSVLTIDSWVNLSPMQIETYQASPHQNPDRINATEWARSSIVAVAVVLVIASYIAALLLSWLPLWDQLTFEPVDMRSTYFRWSQISEGARPWRDATLIDPGYITPRLQVFLPTLIPFIVRQVLDPKATWLFLIAVGWSATLLSVWWLFREDGFSHNAAALLAIAYIVFEPILGNLPLSMHQAHFVLRFLTLSFDYYRPIMFQPGSEYISLPFFFALTAFTLHILSSEFERLPVTRQRILAAVWVVLALLWPLIYFFYWLQFAALLPVLALAMLLTGRTTKQRLWRLARLLPIVAVGWAIYYMLQTSLLAGEYGAEYLIRLGLQKGRYFYMVPGSAARAILFLIVTLVLRPILERSLVIWIAVSVQVTSLLFLNLQLITGQTFQTAHFLFLNQEMIALWVLAVLPRLWAWLNTRWPVSQRLMPFQGALLIAFLLISAGYNLLWHLRSWGQVVERSHINPEMAGLLQFFEDHPELRVTLTDNADIQSNLIFLYARYDYLPWGDHSVISAEERMQRLYEGWRLLRPDESEEQFGAWLNQYPSPYRFFSFKYGYDSTDYASDLWRNPATRDQVLAFRIDNQFPEPERASYEALNHGDNLSYRLDAIIYPVGRAVPDCIADKPALYQDEYYAIYAAPETCAGFLAVR
jgi:hypothetical protein